MFLDLSIYMLFIIVSSMYLTLSLFDSLICKNREEIILVFLNRDYPKDLEAFDAR